MFGGFPDEEVKAFVASAPPDSFGAISPAAREKWVQQIISTDIGTEAERPLHFYGVIARFLAEEWGSTAPEDYSLDTAAADIRKIFVMRKNRSTRRKDVSMPPNTSWTNDTATMYSSTVDAWLGYHVAAALHKADTHLWFAKMIVRPVNT